MKIAKRSSVSRETFLRTDPEGVVCAVCGENPVKYPYSPSRAGIAVSD